jgi:magnesium chelatase family protein
MPRPGEVSLAHHGVLFLDELPEFKKTVLEVLRQPLEDGRVTIARAAMSLAFPARFMLVAAMNPCPCGYQGDPAHECTCTPTQIQRYRSHISGPLMDRIDLHVPVPAVKYKDLGTDTCGEKSSDNSRTRDQGAQDPGPTICQ